MASSTKSALLKTVYVGTFLHNTSLTELDVLESAAIGVDGNGVIAFIEAAVSADLNDRIAKHGWAGCDVVRADQSTVGFWFPGFVDTHIHASQFPNAGVFGKSTLLSWLNTYTFPLESSLESVSKARSVYTHCIRRGLAHGTTTASYFATTHVASTNLLASLCLSLGQRAFIGRCNMDSHIHPPYYVDASPASALSDTRSTISHVRSIDPAFELITPILTPRFAPSCTAPLLSGLAALHRETGLPIQTHLSENDAEMALVKRLHPQHETYTDIYDAHGLLTPRTVLAHSIHLSPAERATLAARGSAVAHCPISNSYLGSGICPVRELLDAGVTVGLGTDMSGGWSPSVLAAAREAGGVSRLRGAPSVGASAGGEAGQEARDRLKLSVEETLWMATRGGAKALGLESKVGGWEVGKLWDAQFVDLGKECAFHAHELGDDDDDDDEVALGGRGNVQVWEGQGWDERLAKWVFCGDERNTRAVWVAGKLVSGGI